MNQDQGPHEKKQTEPACKNKNKKAYQKPSFRYERVFETVALSCGKIAINSSCQFSRKSS